MTSQRDMTRAQLLVRCAILGILLGVWGCTIGPRTATNYVLIHPGDPILILEDRAYVQGRPLYGADNLEPTDWNVSGWVAMPQDSYQYLRKLATKDEPE